jgi:membrane protease YdiL (CAAX protease family)
MSVGIVPGILYLATVLIIARGMDKHELRRILAWRDIPLHVLGAIMVMFFGFEILKSELNNVFQNLLQVPEGFFDGWFYTPNSIFLTLLSSALFPGFTEEVFFRGIIARRFFRTYSPWKAILISAALFGIFHMNPWQAVNAFYLGIFLAWIYRRYRTIWLCMIIHIYHNVLARFMAYPYIKIDNSDYQELWRHPVWFDILGLVLFSLGLWMVIELSRKPKKQTSS